MTPLRFYAVCVLGVTLAACAKEATFVEPIGPLASITWLNAASDTSQLDIRVVDIPTNAGLFDANFRSILMYPQGIEAGPREIKVFLSSADPTIAQQYLLDTTFNFVEGQRYSFYVAGWARSGLTPPLRAVITQANVPTLAAGQIAIRLVNLAPSLAGATPALADTMVAGDAFVRRVDALPGGAPEIQNVGYLGVSNYVTMPAGRYAVGLTGTGGTGTVFAAAPVPPGDAASPTIGGSLVPGTVLTAIIVPRSLRWAATVSSGGRPTTRATDTTVAEASRRVSRSGDTVTVQSGSVSILTNRDSVLVNGILQPQPDSTVGRTGTGAATSVAAGDVVFVLGAAQAEYNGWQSAFAGSGTLGASGVADSLSCNPATPGQDTAKKCAARNVVATTRFRFRYRIAGAPASPGTGTVQYRVYPPNSAADFNTPFVTFVVDRRP